MIDRLEYFWGLFSDPAQASAAGATDRLCLVGDEVSEDIRTAYVEHGISELCGDYGCPGAGIPEEVSHLDITVDGERRRIRVLNHGIALVHASTPELVRLLRFFVVLEQEVDE